MFYPTYEPIINVKQYNIKLAIKCEANFTEKLKDKKDLLYKEYEKNFTNSLSTAYKDAPGFIEIRIISFRSGSIVCNYEAIFDLVETDTNTVEIIKTKVKENINNLKTLPGSVNEEYTENNFKQVITEDVAERFTDRCIGACPESAFCTKIIDGVRCDSKCTNFSCLNDGICKILDDEPVCSCKESDDYTYSGTLCKNKEEKLPLSKKEIIIITSSVVGVILLFLIIISVVLVYKRSVKRRRKAENYLNDDEGQGSRGSLYRRTDQHTESSRFSRDASSSRNGIEMVSNGTNRNEFTKGREEFKEVINNSFEMSGLPRRSSYIYAENETSSKGLQTSFNGRSSHQRASGDYIHKAARHVSQSPLSVYGVIDTECDFQIPRPKLTV